MICAMIAVIAGGFLKIGVEIIPLQIGVINILVSYYNIL